MNSINLLGRLVRDVQLFAPKTTDGQSFAFFDLAVDEYRGKNKPKGTVFIKVKMSGKNAETVASNFRGGDPILVTGRLTVEQWEKDGKRHTRHAVFMERFSFIPSTERRARRVDPIQDDHPCHHPDDLDSLPF